MESIDCIDLRETQNKYYITVRGKLYGSQDGLIFRKSKKFSFFLSYIRRMHFYAYVKTEGNDCISIVFPEISPKVKLSSNEFLNNVFNSTRQEIKATFSNCLYYRCQDRKPALYGGHCVRLQNSGNCYRIFRMNICDYADDTDAYSIILKDRVISRSRLTKPVERDVCLFYIFNCPAIGISKRFKFPEFLEKNIDQMPPK